MVQFKLKVLCHSPDETAALARKLGLLLRIGDCLLLDGPIGAGKTHFARSLLRGILRSPEDIPSPTFTLVQTYDTECGDVWHADLYRLNGPHDLMEIGLTEAFETGICLIEWPDRLGDLIPDGALYLRFTDVPGKPMARQIEFGSSDQNWGKRVGDALNA